MKLTQPLLPLPTNLATMESCCNIEEAESHKLPSSQYKGVVPQPNGRWGGQIYEKHQRVWLGTFNEEPDAAKAYDVAAQRFRGRDAVTNFKPLTDTSDSEAAELGFLNSHSKSEIVAMLRKHTYRDELRLSKSTIFTAVSVRRIGIAVEHLFDKTLTPSDVGKLNRLVIPKQHAEKYFPMRIGSGLLLNFEDPSGKVWRFRYSYWNSSQSYVLTKGWSRFVKEKSLRAGDVVSFRRSDQRQLYIEWKPRSIHVVRLFGVNIFELPTEKTGDAKRRMQNVEMMTSPKMLKKQRVCSL